MLDIFPTNELQLAGVKEWVLIKTRIECIGDLRG